MRALVRVLLWFRTTLYKQRVSKSIFDVLPSENEGAAGNFRYRCTRAWLLGGGCTGSGGAPKVRHPSQST